MASCSNTKSIKENKFQQVNNVFCGWRSQGNYSCNLCFLLFLISYLCHPRASKESPQSDLLLESLALARWDQVSDIFHSNHSRTEILKSFPLFKVPLVTLEQNSDEEKILIQDYEFHVLTEWFFHFLFKTWVNRELRENQTFRLGLKGNKNLIPAHCK